MVCSTILFHSCLSSTFALQPIIFIIFRSSSTWSIHLDLGLPAGLVLYGVHSVIFLLVLVFSILITWAAHFSICDFINFIISTCQSSHRKCYIVSKFILLAMCVEKEWRNREVCEWQIIRTSGCCYNIVDGRKQGYSEGIRLGTYRVARRAYQLLQFVGIKINGLRSSWRSETLNFGSFGSLKSSGGRCMVVSLTHSERSVGLSYGVHTCNSTGDKRKFISYLTFIGPCIILIVE